jgi:hypothetical protein
MQMSIDEATTAPATKGAGELPLRRRRLHAPSARTVLVSLILASVGFGGGVLEARHKGVTTSPASTGGAFTAAAAARTGAAAGQGGAGSMTFGTVKLVDGDTIYLTTTDGSVVKVTTSNSTKVQVSTTSASTALTAGATVVVQGTADASGNVTATSISQSATSSAAPASTGARLAASTPPAG